MMATLALRVPLTPCTFSPNFSIKSAYSLSSATIVLFAGWLASIFAVRLGGYLASSSRSALAGSGFPSSSRLALSAVPAAMRAVVSSAERVAPASRATLTSRSAAACGLKPSNWAASSCAPPAAAGSASTARGPSSAVRHGRRLAFAASALYPHVRHTRALSEKWPGQTSMCLVPSAVFSRPNSHSGQRGSAPCSSPSTH
mmetsp:Transcript_2257/g.7160  ORF Transcript_2257/g.7160 Transcript_2257/m.7160 type:complete len:200 (-) Transcript_2257:452-1051(-)